VAWLAVLVATAIVAGAVAAGIALRHHGQRTVAARSTQASPVVLETALSVERDKAIISVVAEVSVTNEGDKPLLYLGIACSDPATVAFHSTRPYPPSPRYSNSAAALRTKILDYRRSRDEAGYFEAAQTGRPTSNPPCDKTGMPNLPPHQTLRFAEKNGIVAGDYTFIDSASTDVVTTVQLAEFPDPGLESVGSTMRMALGGGRCRRSTARGRCHLRSRHRAT
jgi:hypothetical protein